MRFGFALLLLASIATAGPDKAVLAQGQKLSAAGKHKEAIAAYENYLATAPDDEIANAELGWSAYQQKDYAKAETATRKAIKNGKDPTYRTDPAAKPKGAALYNLALILDAQGKRADAVQALVDSLAARPNKVVREKLVAFDADKAAAVDPLKPVKMTATMAGPRDGCADCEPTSTKAKPILAAPFEAVEIEQKWAAGALAVKTGGKWYRFDLEGPPPCGGKAVELQRAAVTTRGKLTLLEVEYTANGRCSSLSGGHENDWTVKTRNTVVVGIGASGVPSATRPVSTMIDAVHKVDGSWYGGSASAGKVAWNGSVLELSGTFEAIMYDGYELATDDLAGKHVLAFP